FLWSTTLRPLRTPCGQTSKVIRGCSQTSWAHSKRGPDFRRRNKIATFWVSPQKGPWGRYGHENRVFLASFTGICRAPDVGAVCPGRALAGLRRRVAPRFEPTDRPR